ncbi:MAG: secretion system protein E [Methanophagales archaeon ANME-1-THS]|nr:MAG: secretion system protein E [Methanophagales archaeon ANME-1-THS]
MEEYWRTILQFGKKGDGARKEEREEEQEPPVKNAIHEQTGVELERYSVNEPYAEIRIVNSSPPLYEVLEPELSIGEEELLQEIKTYLYETIDLSFARVPDHDQFLREKVEALIGDLGIPVSPQRLDTLMYYVKRDFIGYGKLDPIIRDKMAEDISADGPGIPLYVYHRRYGSIETNVTFDKTDLDAMIYKLAQRGGRHISMAKPLLDASLPTKDRLQLSIGNEITTRGSTFTIRKFKEIPITPIELIDYGTFSVEMIAYLWMAVEHGSNILISGGTASGKTTVLNAISMFIPPESKIVSIEDTREINLLHQNWIPAVTREAEEGGRSIDMFTLLRAALRQRPEYILVGEVRGQEAYTLFQAMATGHITLSTVHADSADAIVKRLTKPPIDVPLMLLDSLDIIPIQRAVKVGNRRVRRCTQIMEVTGIDFDNESLKTNELFSWRPDKFIFSKESNVFVEIMDSLNMDEHELSEEFARRAKILEWMLKTGMNDFESLSKMIFEYSLNPGDIEKQIEDEHGSP